MNQDKDGHWYQAEFGTPFKNLPLRLMKRWWETTCYGKHPALGDAERTEQTMGKKKIIDPTTKAENLLEEKQALFACMLARDDESAGQDTKEIRRDIVKIVMAWRRSNHSPPRWELPALMGLYKKEGIPQSWLS